MTDDELQAMGPGRREELLRQLRALEDRMDAGDATAIPDLLGVLETLPPTEDQRAALAAHGLDAGSAAEALTLGQLVRRRRS